MDEEIGEGFLQWGMRITLPDGSTYVEIIGDRSSATHEVHSIERDKPELKVELVSRIVIYSPWDEATIGTKWGIRRTWPDGYSEIQETNTRHRAESAVRLEQPSKSRLLDDRGEETATVVSRTVTATEWK